MLLRANKFARFTKTFAVTAVLSCAALGLAPAASAAAYPQTAPLVDASGDKSGCVVTAAVPKTVIFRGHSLLDISVSGTCDPTWERVRVDVALIEVAPGGKQTVVSPRTEIGLSQEMNPVIGGGLQRDCSPGTHTYIARWYLKVKHSLNDPNPYKATVQARATLTCV